MTEFESISAITRESLRANLARAGSRAFAAYQYSMDVSLFFLSGALLANEKDFTQLKGNVRFAPSEAHSLSFERAKFESQRWLLKNTLQEVLRVVSGILEDTRTICSLVAHLDQQDAELQAALKEVTGKSRSAFSRLSLVARLERLKADFGIECPHHPAIMSLLKLANCLQSHGGVVTKADADNGPELVIHLFGISLTQQEPAAGDSARGTSAKGLQMHLKQGIKRIPVGQPVEFTRGEHLATILSLCIFTSSLLREADRFIQAVDPCLEVAAQ
ncbi:MAG: hypothetical protein NTW21_13935 [Verrucomicrobia bacterium]|nr:hypothetical protein [Verrucomicrobiota bacterium]